MIAGLFALVTALPVASAEEPPPPSSIAEQATSEVEIQTEVQPPAVERPADPAVSLRGSVWRTKSGIVFLKTPIGLLTLSSKTTLKDLKASHDVLFWVHDRSMVVEIRKKGEGSLVHRYLTGPMTFGEDAPKTLQWWTPEGEEATHFGTQEGRLNSFHEGDVLTVEVDQSHTILGVHDLQFDLQISQTPPAGSQVHVVMSGTVSRLKSNFIFFRTPVGVVMVNSKIGIPRVKVGQPLTLRIDDHDVSVDLVPSSSGLQPDGTSPAHSPASPH
ncbi:hypothetical protein W02_22570 [Nitrospira sp. KM1]|uniref:hypothetical protein n=1 Tax=Nitrospira sp. KM1 TaxID=1936990 RepID=UPI0013A747D0|nr:hypothetical protein [Nitrospira sp. KM1]BCA55117.1 hypothetical protein W02_22570 [Nitrospira sp. KM1]